MICVNRKKIKCHQNDIHFFWTESLRANAGFTVLSFFFLPSTMIKVKAVSRSIDDMKQRSYRSKTDTKSEPEKEFCCQKSQ